MVDLPHFISRFVTGRTSSLFEQDVLQYQPQLSESINGRSVLVVGGAGSIGSAFIKALLPFRPDRVFVVDTSENGLAELVRDLRSSLLPMPGHFQTYPVDFGDPVFARIFQREGPFHIVANFAAHKHVRSEKDPYAIEALLSNNLFKARHLLDLLTARKPEHFFCVSTDKAANPANIMGASKKLMELLVQSYACAIPVTTARFANVAFSNGSLLASFVERWMKRQPLSAPLDVERYFVSAEEAGQLCLMACLLGDSGDIFFPKMVAEKDARKFSNIAIDFVQTLGYQPDICETEQEAREKAARLTSASSSWPVYFFESDTSGEKPLEEFYTPEEKLDVRRFSSIGIVKHQAIAPLPITQTINTLQLLFEKDNLQKADIVAALQQFIPEFRHLETGKNLDQKM